MMKASREMGFGDDWHRAGGSEEQICSTGAAARVGATFGGGGHHVVTARLGHCARARPRRLVARNAFAGAAATVRSSSAAIHFGRVPTDTMTQEQVDDDAWQQRTLLAFGCVPRADPGHHLQAHAERYRKYRQIFETPFWSEGNAFYWELLLWDCFRADPKTASGCCSGMHRARRFSLSFHLSR
jgi:hypothetical protein